MTSLYVMVFLFSSITVFIAANGQISGPCANAPNGTLVGIKCFSYSECQNNQVVEVPCATGDVYEREPRAACVNATGANTACGRPMDCSPDKSGFFTDPAYGCQTFYRCISGTPVHNSRQYCGFGLTYFSQQYSFCGNKDQVEPPCGNYIAPTP